MCAMVSNGAGCIDVAGSGNYIRNAVRLVFFISERATFRRTCFGKMYTDMKIVYENTENLRL